MTPLMIVNLITALGPTALDLVQKLAAIWSKPSLTVDEVVALCAPAKKSYDDYIAEAKKSLIIEVVQPPAPPVVVVPEPVPAEEPVPPGTNPVENTLPAEPPALTVVEVSPVTTETATPEPASPTPPPAAPA